MKYKEAFLLGILISVFFVHAQKKIEPSVSSLEKSNPVPEWFKDEGWDLLSFC